MDLSTINPNTALSRVVAFPVKAPAKPKVKAEDLALKYGEAKYREGFQRAVDTRSRNTAYDDLGHEAPDFEPLRDEIERLECAEYDRDQILEATTGVLLVLSRLWLDGKLTADDMAEVIQFRQAVKEARNG